MKFVLFRSRRPGIVHIGLPRLAGGVLSHLRGVTTTMAGFWPGHYSRANALPWRVNHGDTVPRERPPVTLHEQPLPI
jgi:hypothetical protein